MSSDATFNKAEHTGRLTCYLGHIISPVSEAEYTDIVDGALLVDENGVIVCVDHRDHVLNAFSQFAGVVDYGKRLLVPGFVDMHLHLPQIPHTGRSGQTLLGWLDRYVFPAEASFAKESHAAKVSSWFFDELAANGTTCAVVFTTIHAKACDIAFQTALEKGSRVIMGKVMMDSNSPASLTEKTEDSLKQAEELCQKWHGVDNGRLLYAFTPRFAVSSTAALLSGCGELWHKYPGTYLHTHLAENKEEVSFVQQQFPDARSYLDVYARHGLIGHNSVLAHSIHLDDQDLSELSKTQSSLAHCPSSNFFLKSGVFPFHRVKQAKVRFGLGSDVGGGPQLSMFGVMKDASYMQMEHWIAPAELFYRATAGGAKALDLDAKIGSLESGKEADFVVVDPTRKTGVPKDILDQRTEDILSSMIYLGDDRFVVATYVRGKKIHQAQEAVLQAAVK